jgi:Uma2 family endonuclease
MQQIALKKITEAQYLEEERRAEVKSEFYNGEIFVMAGASRRHNLIVANVIITLGQQLKNKPCRVYPGDMRLRIGKTGLYTYPDVMVVCGQEAFSDETEDTLLNPTVIIEVLSDSTEEYNRGKKFWHYRQLNSLKEYILISQKSQNIEKYFISTNQQWTLAETDEKQTSVVIESIGCVLNIEDVYDKI